MATDSHLVTCPAEVFDANIDDMTSSVSERYVILSLVMELMTTISMFQHEMENEQQQFDVISKLIEERGKSGDLQKRLIASQTTLTNLAQRNMKCFVMQNKNIVEGRTSTDHGSRRASVASSVTSQCAGQEAGDSSLSSKPAGRCLYDSRSSGVVRGGGQAELPAAARRISIRDLRGRFESFDISECGRNRSPEDNNNDVRAPRRYSSVAQTSNYVKPASNKVPETRETSPRNNKERKIIEHNNKEHTLQNDKDQTIKEQNNEQTITVEINNKQTIQVENMNSSLIDEPTKTTTQPKRLQYTIQSSIPETEVLHTILKQENNNVEHIRVIEEIKTDTSAATSDMPTMNSDLRDTTTTATAPETTAEVQETALGDCVTTPDAAGVPGHDLSLTGSASLSAERVHLVTSDPAAYVPKMVALLRDDVGSPSASSIGVTSRVEPVAPLAVDVNVSTPVAPPRGDGEATSTSGSGRILEETDLSDDEEAEEDEGTKVPEEEAVGQLTTGDVVPAYKMHFRKARPDNGEEIAGGAEEGGGQYSDGTVTLRGDEVVQDRVTCSQWEPKKLLEELYKLRVMKQPIRKNTYINMEGFMEKLPINKKKSSLLKTWKRRYFRAIDGILYYYDNELNKDEVHGSFLLANGKIEDLGNRILGIDDSKGHYLLVRIQEQKDMLTWKRALQSQTTADLRSMYIRPMITGHQHEKKVIIIDIGSCSIRAGILRQQTCLPELFFPTVCSIDESSPSDVTFGIEALSRKCRLPDSGKSTNISFPINPTSRQDQSSVDLSKMKALFTYIFKDLRVNPSEYLVMLSTPAVLSDSIKAALMTLLVSDIGVAGVNMQAQSSLVLYAYTAKSGVVVDCGHRLDIIPIMHGYIVQGGVAKEPYGGEKMVNHFRQQLALEKYPYFNPVEEYIVRYAMEKLSYVTDKYEETVRKCEQKPSHYRDRVSLRSFEMGASMPKSISATYGRFQSPEGLFDPSVWGQDNASIQRLVANAVQACSMDMRREMWKSIYLSGGVTQCVGFADRLTAEVKKIAPPTVEVVVHASPNRYHCAYIGASVLASLKQFEQSCISRAEWTTEGASSLRKWHDY